MRIHPKFNSPFVVRQMYLLSEAANKLGVRVGVLGYGSANNLYVTIKCHGRSIPHEAIRVRVSDVPKSIGERNELASVHPGSGYTIDDVIRSIEDVKQEEYRSIFAM